MEHITIAHSGNLRTAAQHERSGVKLSTDAPVDNNGLGQSFSPTDLLATALGSCMLTLMGIKAGKAGFELGAVRTDVWKEMASKPRRVARVRVEFHLEDRLYSSEEKALLWEAATTCPVSQSVHPDLQQEVRFHYRDGVYTGG